MSEAQRERLDAILATLDAEGRERVERVMELVRRMGAAEFSSLSLALSALARERLAAVEPNRVQ